jgi:hypothetical protein
MTRGSVSEHRRLQDAGYASWTTSDGYVCNSGSDPSCKFQTSTASKFEFDRSNCATAECKALILPVKPELRTNEEIENSLCKRGCTLLGPGVMIPTSKAPKVIFQWAIKHLATEGVCEYLIPGRMALNSPPLVANYDQHSAPLACKY